MTPDQLALQVSAIAFARKHLQDDVVARDRDAVFSRELWQRCADYGVLAMPIPREHGGAGLGATDLIAVMEGLGYGMRDQGLLFSMNAHLWTNSLPILAYGTKEQQAEFLPGLCDGSLIGANGASEPGAGSDIFSMRTRAVRDGDRYVLDGTKTFVTNAQVADLFVVYATTDPALGPMGITAFILDKSMPGLSIGSEIQKMGLRTSPMAELVLQNCVVPVGRRLGREGRGVEVFGVSMEWERGCILASCIGAMRHLLDRCIDHARSRVQFGKSIGKFQSVANRIVDMKVRIDTCRPLVYRVGALKDAGKSAVLEASIAKLEVAECYVQSALDAVQVFGGYGYTTDMELEREVRNALGSRLYSGTSEVQRNVIARELNL